MDKINPIIHNALQAAAELEYKNPPATAWKTYLNNRYQDRVFILMDLLKYKGLSEHGHEYWGFYAIPEDNRLFSDTLARYCRDNLFTGEHNISPDIKDILLKLDSLTGTCSPLVHKTGIDAALNNACLLLYRISKEQFTESYFMLEAAKKSLLAKSDFLTGNIFSITETLTLTQMFTNHPAFAHLKDNFNFFTEWLANLLYLRAKDMTQLAKTIETLSKKQTNN